MENRIKINDKFEIQSYILTEYNEKEGNYLYSLASLDKKNYPYSNKFNLFGALNFYNTNIKLNNCKFFRIELGRCIKYNFLKFHNRKFIF